MAGKLFKNILTDKIGNREAEEHFQALDLRGCPIIQENSSKMTKIFNKIKSIAFENFNNIYIIQLLY